MQRITCHDIAAYSYRYRQQCRANKCRPTLLGILIYMTTGGDPCAVYRRRAGGHEDSGRRDRA